MTPAFCILSAGRGSRLGELTSSINKALLPVANKATISHIIEKVPQDCEIVIAVGYDKEKLTEYCLAAHPERSFIFVDVDRLEGPGSGPGYSLLCCEEHLQRPFYLCNVDTIVTDSEFPSLKHNWLGVAWTDSALPFVTVGLEGWKRKLGPVLRVWDKGTNSEGCAYIGLAGIRDWNKFWSRLLAKHDESLEFQYVEAFKDWCAGLYAPIEEHLYCYPLNWLDTGSVEGYQQACDCFEGGQVLGLPKNISEITYKVGGRLVKLCLDSAKNNRRLSRAELLQEHIPQLVFKGRYVMAYEWVEGCPLYAMECGLDDWLDFLTFCETELWTAAPEPDRWPEICRAFYADKTWERMYAYLHSRGWVHGGRLYINGYRCYFAEAYLTYLNWDHLCDGIPVPFHGDLQFDNVISGVDGQWYLIDWRDCFGDSLKYGDLYYDLAKLYSGLDLPYDKLKREEFNFCVVEDDVTYSYPIDSKLVGFKEIYEGWLVKKGYDLHKVKTLAALVYINMAPLHPGPIGDLLFYHGIFKLALLHDWTV
jgi:GTP:adenosylcobinamide-phosphate guanylyltransferase